MKIVHPTERLAPGIFTVAMCAALAAWAWLTIGEGMGYHAEWWAAVLAASVAACAAFIMDASSTAKFGRGMVAACEGALLLRLAARRYTLRSCFILQSTVEVCLVAATPWLLSPLPAHHALVCVLVLISFAHCYGWVQNSRLWEACAHD